MQQLPILPFARLLTFRSFVPQSVCNRDHPLGDAALPIANPFLQSAGLLLALLRRARQYPRPILQQPTVGRVMNIGFHHRGVYAHLAALDHLTLLAIATRRSCKSRSASGPTACPSRTNVFASVTFSIPIRQKLRYTKLARTSR